MLGKGILAFSALQMRLQAKGLLHDLAQDELGF